MSDDKDMQVEAVDVKVVLQCFSVAILGLMERGHFTTTMLDTALADAFNTVMQSDAANEFATKRVLEANGVVMKLAELSFQVRQARAEMAN